MNLMKALAASCKNRSVTFSYTFDRGLYSRKGVVVLLRSDLHLTLLLQFFRKSLAVLVILRRTPEETINSIRQLYNPHILRKNERGVFANQKKKQNRKRRDEETTRLFVSHTTTSRSFKTNRQSTGLRKRSTNAQPKRNQLTSDLCIKRIFSTYTIVYSTCIAYHLYLFVFLVQ